MDYTKFTTWNHDDGDTTVTSAAAVVMGVYCNGSVTGSVTIRDGTTAGGTSVAIIGGFALGDFIDLFGVYCPNGVFLDDAATAGNITVLWKPV